MSSEVEVTFKIPKGYTHTHAGQQVADGQKAKVSPRQKERLAERGLIVTASRTGLKGKSRSTSEPKDDE